ncbi:MAG: hypothetical protein HQK88_05535 [Nitrospirae bacterium]|nr:hypothetical protein [Nitrospirota bacterium]MBF0534692.1 hypothetical protein [Nitrospirota bacterium]MBF0616264.1 hypothetical protein [Nitrospirota bacterium]
MRTASNIASYSLLGLLPIIAAVIYLTGQHYDPAVIDFKSHGSGVSLPASIDDLKQLPNPRSFSKDNLYEYIDGHADYFIGNGFVSLNVVEYIKTNGNPASPDITVEVYDMSLPIQAFGVLTGELSEGAESVEIGNMGYMTSKGINFFTGRYFVKVTSFSGGFDIKTIAGKIAASVNPNPEPFPLFAAFPDVGTPTAIRFIKESYRGVDFMKNVLEREYTIVSKHVTIALLSATKENSAVIIQQTISFLNKSKVKFEEVAHTNAKYYKITDPYEGTWYLIPNGERVFALYGDVDDGIIGKVIKQ